MLVEVPDGMPADVAVEAMRAAKNKMDADERLHSQWEAACTDHAAAQRWALDRGWPWKTAIGRAHYYAGALRPSQEMRPGYLYPHSARPVLMRGSLAMLMLAHSRSGNPYCSNGWCSEVLSRFLRIKKVTFMSDEDEARAAIMPAAHKLRDKHAPSHHFMSEASSMCLYDYIGGKRWRGSTAARDHLKTLYDVLKKCKTPEERRASVRRRIRSNEL